MSGMRGQLEGIFRGEGGGDTGAAQGSRPFCPPWPCHQPTGPPPYFSLAPAPLPAGPSSRRPFSQAEEAL